jgi:seryl-tRNA synthetase
MTESKPSETLRTDAKAWGFRRAIVGGTEGAIQWALELERELTALRAENEALRARENELIVAVESGTNALNANTERLTRAAECIVQLGRERDELQQQLDITARSLNAISRDMPRARNDAYELAAKTCEEVHNMRCACGDAVRNLKGFP